AVEQGVVGVKMKMDELRLGHSELEPLSAASILFVSYDACSLRKVWKTGQEFNRGFARITQIQKSSLDKREACRACSCLFQSGSSVFIRENPWLISRLRTNYSCGGICPLGVPGEISRPPVIAWP